MDRRRFSAIAHTDHVISSPISERKADRVIDLMDLPTGAQMLDLGCGKGEILLRAVARYQGQGLGVDIAKANIEEARKRAEARGLAAKCEFREEAIEDFEAPPHSYDLVMNVGSIPEHGFEPMIERMQALTRPNGLMLLGHGFWKRDPELAYLEEFGATREEFIRHSENVATLQKKGLTFLYAVVASDDDWDHYEGLYNRAIHRYVAAHPDDPEAPEMVARINDWHETYLKWGRDTLGFALYLVRNDLRLRR